MRATRWMLAVLAWATCVGVVATVAWYAIDSAGRQVTLLAAQEHSVAAVVPAEGPAAGPASPPDPGPATASPSTTAPTPEPTIGEGASTSRPSPRPSRPRHPTPTAADGSDGSDHSGDSDGSVQSPSPTPTTGPPEVTVRTQAYSTRGGVVTVICRTPREIGFTVRPAQGWSAHGEQVGPQQVEIELRRDRDRIEVHASCRDGEPRADLDEEDDD